MDAEKVSRTLQGGDNMSIDQEKMIVEALPSLYPLQKFEKAAIDAVLDALPSAEPKRGKWIKLDMHRGMEDHKCSVCEQECYVPTCMGEPMYAYCPNCGAEMEVNHESN